MTSLVLPAAALAGLLYTITPGPGVLAAFATGASRGRRPAGLFLSGHYVADVLWTTLALVSVAGAAVISPRVTHSLALLSGLYLFWLGFHALRTRPRQGQAQQGVSLTRPLLHGLTFGLTNPKAYPVAAATLTALLSSAGSTLNPGILPVLLLASCAGSLAGDLFLVFLAGTGTFRRFWQRHDILVTRLCGILFIGFALHALHQGLSGFLAERRG